MGKQKSGQGPGKGKSVKSGKIRKPNKVVERKAPTAALKPVDWTSVELPPFERKLYKERPKAAARSSVEVDAYRAKHRIVVNGVAPNPILAFDEISLPKSCMKEIRRQEHKSPTPIQAQTWPIALSGFNMVSVGKTGPGKTLAFLLPAIVHIKAQPPLKKGDGPIAVVIVANREVGERIISETIELVNATSLRAAYAVGNQVPAKSFEDSPHLVIATPSRLLALLSKGKTNLRRCTFLVLDEVDHIIDLGLKSQIKGILSQIRPDRQILMWTADWPKEVQNFAKSYLNDYIQISTQSATRDIPQNIAICHDKQKGSKLKELLKKIYSNGKEKAGKIVIFVSTKRRVDKVARFIASFLEWCGCYHGGQSHSKREEAMDEFREGVVNILVATDVAARVLDVDGIGHVINFDFPQTVEYYIHRIRVASRGEHTGITHTFITHLDAPNAKGLLQVLRDTNQVITPTLEQLLEQGEIPVPKGSQFTRIYGNSGLFTTEEMEFEAERQELLKMKKEKRALRAKVKGGGGVKKRKAVDLTKSGFMASTQSGFDIHVDEEVHMISSEADESSARMSSDGRTNWAPRTNERRNERSGGRFGNRSRGGRGFHAGGGKGFGVSTNVTVRHENYGNRNHSQERERNRYAGAGRDSSQRMEEDSYQHRPPSRTDWSDYGPMGHERGRFDEDPFRGALRTDEPDFNDRRFGTNNNERTFGADNQRYRAANRNVLSESNDMKNVIEMLLNKDDLDSVPNVSAKLERDISNFLDNMAFDYPGNDAGTNRGFSPESGRGFGEDNGRGGFREGGYRGGYRENSPGNGRGLDIGNSRRCGIRGGYRGNSPRNGGGFEERNSRDGFRGGDCREGGYRGNSPGRARDFDKDGNHGGFTGGGFRDSNHRESNFNDNFHDEMEFNSNTSGAYNGEYNTMQRAGAGAYKRGGNRPQDRRDNEIFSRRNERTATRTHNNVVEHRLPFGNNMSRSRGARQAGARFFENNARRGGYN